MLKFVKTTTVDYRTGIPSYEAPTENGPTLPDGVEFIFESLSSKEDTSRGWVSPKIWGVVEGVVEAPSEELAEERFWQDIKEELIFRVKDKKWEIEGGGIPFEGRMISTSETDRSRINSLYVGRENIGESLIDFTTESETFQLNRAQVESLYKTLFEHTQECFSWQASMIAHIKSFEVNYENCKEFIRTVSEAIADFGISKEFTDPEG